MARPYTVTIRARPRAEKERFGRLRDALDAIERRGRELETLIREAVWRKELKHRVGEPGFRQPPRTMSAIGG